MKYDEAKKIVDGIVENEFIHIQRLKENEFSNIDTEQEQLSKNATEIFEELRSTLSKEQEELLFDLEFAICNEWTNLCIFYFKEGLRAGLSNLKFLNEIGFVESIL